MSHETSPVEQVEQVETRTVREEPSPLVMKTTRTRKEDGRVLIYYEFCRPSEAGAVPQAGRSEAPDPRGQEKQ
jgi:hypothetical protein